MKRILKGLLVALAVACLLFLVCEGVASLVLAWKTAAAPPTFREQAHCKYDPELGWSQIPGKQVTSLYGPGLGLTVNAQGFRGTRDHSLRTPAGAYRIVCLGDSFTMGYGVSDAESYPAQLERLRPGLESINMGLGGYGVSQCYLWYLRDGVKFECDFLLLSVIGSDFYRMMSDRDASNAYKPGLKIEDGELLVTNVPVPSILEGEGTAELVGKTWEISALARLMRRIHPPKPEGSGPRAPADEPFAPLARAVIERLRDLSRERGQGFAVAYLPVRDELEAGGSSVLYEWLTPLLTELSVPLIDLFPPFLALDPGTRLIHFAPDGHYSKLGNELAARELLSSLQLIDPRCPR